VPTPQVEGLIEATNANRLKIAGAWVNVSRFHLVELPEPGAHVRLEVDSRGYIKELEVLSKPQTPALFERQRRADHVWRCSRPRPTSSACSARRAKMSAASTCSCWPTAGWHGWRLIRGS
jgi:hypothetical protein